MIDGFSIAFFAAAILGLCTLAAAMRWLPESLSTQVPRFRSEEPDPDWRTLGRSLGPLLSLALVTQFALAMFEATFALHAQAVLNYGPAEVGAVFVVCGFVMAVFQLGASGPLIGGALFVCQMNAYLLSGGVLVIIAMVIGWNALRRPSAATRVMRQR